MISLKTFHILCAYITGLGFLVRGLLALAQSPFGKHRVTKTLPHIIDACLLFSGLALLYSWSVSILTLPWLLAKVVILFAYIGFGLLMLRWGSTVRRRQLGLMGGILTYVYIVGAAHSKSVLSWIAVV